MTSLRRFVAPTLSPGLSAVLWGACAAIVLVVLTGLVRGDEDVAGYRVAFRLVGAAFVACGLIAWRRRPDSLSGLLMTATGFLLFVEPLSAQFEAPAARVLGDLFEDLWSIPLAWLLLTMLSGGRLVTRVDRVLVGAFVVEFLLTFACALFWEREGNFLQVRADQSIADGLETARALLVSAACIAIAVVIGRRWRAASSPRRRAMLPSVLGISVLLFFALAQQAPPLWLRWLAVLSLLTIPAGFLIGMLRSRLARASLADLFRALPSMRGAQLEAALARAMGDPGLKVVYAHGPEGRTLAALHYDPSLDEDPELVEAVTAAAAMALENERLHEQSAARLAELQASRERIVSAGDAERRRLERNLHDGAQQRLVALAMQLRLLQMQIHSDPVEAEKLVGAASDELALSLAELRELARGIHPAVLDHGLPTALEALTSHCPVPTSLRCEGADDLPEAIELAAYFVTSEALTNVAKYAQAAAGARVRAADAVVVDRHEHLVAEPLDGDGRARRVCVLGDVGQGLGDHEVRGGLDGGGQALGRHRVESNR